MFNQSALTNADSYKLGHADQYPEGTEFVYSNFTPRSNAHLNIPKLFKDDKIVWAGTAVMLDSLVNIWKKTFFEANIDEVVAEFEAFVAPFVGPKGFNTSRIRELHKLGYLPIKIKALPEGSVVPIGTPVLTIVNTHPKFFWLTNYLETWMSAEMWKMSTSATIARAYRKILNFWVDKTGSNKDFANWQLHDFSVRGMSGIADAAKSGVGHALFSNGTDNLPAVFLINKIYRGKETFIGGSVPATEHSVMCAGGKDSEVETFKRLIKTYPSGVLSIVSDTWDFWNVISNTAKELKEEILNRTPDSLGLAKVVFRPDSGDPVKIITGYTSKSFDSKTDAKRFILNEVEYGDEEIPEIFFIGDKQFEVDISRWEDSSISAIEFIPSNISIEEIKGAVEVLWDTFGGTTNEKGFRTLNQRVGLIYGDSITPQRAQDILERLAHKGFAADNIVFGIGSFTYQYNTRDTLGFAMKATWVSINGEGKAIFKDPKTDNGVKKSRTGLLRVNRDFSTDAVASWVEEDMGMLEEVFIDGEILSRPSFEEMRKRAQA